MARLVSKAMTNGGQCHVAGIRGVLPFWDASLSSKVYGLFIAYDNVKARASMPPRSLQSRELGSKSRAFLL